MQQIILQPQTPDELRLVKQFAKVMKIKANVVNKETDKAKRKQEILDSIERGARDVSAALRGEIKLQSARDVLNEL